GERIAVRNHLGGTAAVFLRDLGGNPLRVYLRTSTGSWSWSRDDVWVGRERVASVYASGVQYVHSDHLGSPRKVTDSLGNVVASNDFYPFGLPAATTGLQGSWFSGYELEHQNTASTYTDDLYFLHARWYFPQLARFLSPDPVRGEVFSPESLNLFAYVGGNPTNLVDPWGLAASGGSGGGPGYRILPDGRICVFGEDGEEHCGYSDNVTVTAPAERAGGVPSDYFRQQQMAELYAWAAMQDRAAFAGQRISSHGFVFLRRLFDAIAANTDIGVSASLFYRGWSWSADQWGAHGDGTWAFGSLVKGVAPNTQSWVVGADLYVSFGSDRLRALDPPSVGLGFGWPGVGRLPGIEVLFGKSGGVVGISLHFGPSFFFPPGWVTNY
ncbi:RHS repeat domain-containing protein, partial [Thermoanaerobaculum aquaticum]|uniref:RHS repeat domain-containing protein n=1 Tax=Thermoanaerobaculum aquaticum TaxID=1312852 RepID=UPI000570EED1